MHYKAGMPDQFIYILTGKINSGKTTAITNWIAGKNEVFGILTPKILGRRVFKNIETGEQFEMETIADEVDILKIGRYSFSGMAFNKASLILQNGLQNPRGWLIVDEVGPLELQQKGFYKVIADIIENKNTNLKKLLVIRDTLVDEVMSFFGIKDYKILMLPLEME